MEMLESSGFELATGVEGLKQRFLIFTYNLGAKTWNQIVFFLQSFIGLHYIYVISNILILSWIIYPQKNMTYTDALFQAVSAGTLCGLNTVDINRLKTYQQIFLFVYPVILHPLTVATFMVFYRLHLYKRKFSHIEQTSKQQSRLRRAATLSQYDTSRSGRSSRKLAKLQKRTDPQSVNLQLGGPSRTGNSIVHPANWRSGNGRDSGDPESSSSNDVAVIDDDSEKGFVHDPPDHRMDGSTERVRRYNDTDDAASPPGSENDGSGASNPAQRDNDDDSSDSELYSFEEAPHDVDHDAEHEERNDHSGQYDRPDNRPDSRPDNHEGGAKHGTKHEAKHDDPQDKAANEGHDTSNQSTSLGFESPRPRKTSGIESRMESPEVTLHPRHSSPGLKGIEHAPHDEPPSQPGDTPGIKFGALPRPPSKERPEYNPGEMYRSLLQMRSQNHGDDMDEDDGPALVIKSPRDIEADERRGIHSAVADSGSHHRRGSHSNQYQNYPNTPLRRLSTNNAFSRTLSRTLSRADTGMSHASSSRGPRQMSSNYLSWTPTVGRNSAFVGLSHEQIEELGGVEYRALKVLRWIAIAYFVVMLCVGWVFVVPWVYERKKYNDIIEEYGVSPGMFGVTVVLSAFNNHGITVLPSSISDFWQTAYIPVVLSMLIMAGNVALPIMLRFIVWVVFRCSPRYGQTRETLGFLLDHPRRCFMLLFPTNATWWLGATVILFMVVEVSLFMILDSGTHSPHPDMSAGPRLLSAYFQSVAVRTVGFTIIDVAAQAPGMLILNIIMIYVAIYPVAMSIRKSNVYEEQDLGRRHGFKALPPRLQRTGTVGSGWSATRMSNSGPNGTLRLRRPFGIDAEDNPDDRSIRSGASGNRSVADVEHEENEMNQIDPDDDEIDDSPSTLTDHIRRQLSVDIWWFVAGLLLVSISEGGSISRGKYSLFDVLYEVLSAHCCVGLSMGLSGTGLSTCGGFSNVGKLVLMAVMIRGRHRGMPYEIDRAIMLNTKDLIKHDQDQANWTRGAEVMQHREPGDDDEGWFPRVATTATRLASYATINRKNERQHTHNKEDSEGDAADDASTHSGHSRRSRRSGREHFRDDV